MENWITGAEIARYHVCNRVVPGLSNNSCSTSYWYHFS